MIAGTSPLTAPFLLLKEIAFMRKLRLLGLAALTLTLSACGHNMEQRAATGAIAGAGVAGPVGAAVGAAAGAAVDKVDKADGQ